MASGPITSWEKDGETVSDFMFWGSKITADGDCSHEILEDFFLSMTPHGVLMEWVRNWNIRELLMDGIKYLDLCRPELKVYQ